MMEFLQVAPMLFVGIVCILVGLRNLLPTSQIRLSVGTLVAGDTNALNQPTLLNTMRLAAAPFVPSDTLIPASLTEASFTGYAAINQPAGAALTGVDPITLQQKITIPDPAGGYRWATTGLTGLPQTIYGYYLTNSTNGKVWGSALLPTPITLQDVGQIIDLGTINISVLNPPLV